MLCVTAGSDGTGRWGRWPRSLSVARFRVDDGVCDSVQVSACGFFSVHTCSLCIDFCDVYTALHMFFDPKYFSLRLCTGLYVPKEPSISSKEPLISSKEPFLLVNKRWRMALLGLFAYMCLSFSLIRSLPRILSLRTMLSRGRATGTVGSGSSALQCVVVCCSGLRCVAVCCCVLQCVAVLQWVAAGCSVLQCCSVLQWVAVHCSRLQWVVVGCSGLQRVAVGYSVLQCNTHTHARVCTDAYRCSMSGGHPELFQTGIPNSRKR